MPFIWYSTPLKLLLLKRDLKTTDISTYITPIPRAHGRDCAVCENIPFKTMTYFARLRDMVCCFSSHVMNRVQHHYHLQITKRLHILYAFGYHKWSLTRFIVCPRATIKHVAVPMASTILLNSLYPVNTEMMNPSHSTDPMLLVLASQYSSLVSL